ncbi:hypothetical protein V4V48_004192 [Vibrio mimicus]
MAVDVCLCDAFA